MLDFHTHSLLSDGLLLPTELIRRAVVKGYRAIAVTDHVDTSNLEIVIEGLLEACESANRYWDISAIPGVEITHVPLQLIAELSKKARQLGAKLVLVHGETLSEPVLAGTNRAALEADIDILAHPGLISMQEAELARERGIFLELSTRRGHCLGNGHVAKMAIITGAPLLVNTDSHGPSDLLTEQQAQRIAQGAGLNEKQIAQLRQNAQSLLERLVSRPRPLT